MLCCVCYELQQKTTHVLYHKMHSIIVSQCNENYSEVDTQSTRACAHQQQQLMVSVSLQCIIHDTTECLR